MLNPNRLWLLAALLSCVAPSASSAQTATWDGGTKRVAALEPLDPPRGAENGYSFSAWVRLSGTDANFPCIASTKIWERGEVIDLLSSRNMGLTLETGAGLGWTIAIQPNGAWTWNIGDGKTQRLDYLPTAERQSVTDGLWHLLAFTVEPNGKVARLYFDGVNVATYSVNWFEPGAFDQRFIAGADRVHDVAACRITGVIEEAAARDRQLSDEEVVDLYQKRFPDAQPFDLRLPVTQLKVLSWNIWHGARHPGIELGIKQAIAFIRHTQADIITMQETYGSGPKIADALGYHFYQRSDNLSIMSRYPIKDIHRLYRALWFGGATIQLSEQQQINVFTIWLNHLPAWRRDVTADDATGEELIKGEWGSRARELKDILAELQPFVAAADSKPLIVGGDFNSPSLLDWGKDTAEWHNGLEVRWPVSEQMLDQGFSDAYRAIHSDPTIHEAHALWTRTARDLTYRIDYLYSLGNSIQVVDASMMDTHEGAWASDHPAVLTTYELQAASSEPPVWELLWEDEFSGDQLDTTKWTRCERGSPNWRDTMSDDPRLLTLRDGRLHLRGIVNDKQVNRDDPAPFLTAGISSRGKFAFQHGKVGIRARFKSAQGAWPALWMLGTERGWKAKAEIDLMEHLNFDDVVYQTVHSAYTLDIDQTNTPQRYVRAKIDKDGWNTYGCEWNPERIVFTVNGEPTHTYPRMPEKGKEQWPFDQPFYLILSMQVGGSWVNGSGPTDPAHYPAGMELQWVRVFQRGSSATGG